MPDNPDNVPMRFRGWWYPPALEYAMASAVVLRFDAWFFVNVAVAAELRRKGHGAFFDSGRAYLVTRQIVDAHEGDEWVAALYVVRADELGPELLELVASQAEAAP